MKDKLHITEHSYKVTRADREKLNGHRAACLWFSGLSGSGKSTLANHVEQALFEKGIHTFILDGDNIRKGLNNDLCFTAEDRSENLRRVAEVAKLMCNAGLVVLATFISPLEKDRLYVRTLLGEIFFEIFVDTSMEICEKRDTKGLYKKARAGEIENFTGIHSPFEKPTTPDLKIETGTLELSESVELILKNILPRIENLYG